jgi:hypothetical protein
MKIRSAARIVFACFALFLGTITGQVANAAMPGGYREVEVNKDIEAAAAFAVGEQGKEMKEKLVLKSVDKAAQQVVAGMNYALTLKLTAAGKPREANVVVFRALDGTYKLTSWAWVP